MATAHDIWHTPFFWQPLRLRWNSPFAHRADTTELDPPYRVSRPVVLHLWPTTLGLVFGRWQPGPEHDHAEEEFFLDDNVGRTEDDAIGEALGMEVLGDWERPLGVAMPKPVHREYGNVVMRTHYKPGTYEVESVEIVEAPKFVLIDKFIADVLPHWRGKEHIVKVGDKRYWLHGLDYFQHAWQAERVDRRSVREFLWGGAQPWD